MTVLTGYKSIFNITNKNNKFHFTKSITDKDAFIQITIPKGTSEIESLNNEIKRINFEGEQLTEANCPFTMKPKFLTLGSFIEKSRQEHLISSLPDDKIRNFLGFIASTLYETLKE